MTEPTSGRSPSPWDCAKQGHVPVSEGGGCLNCGSVPSDEAVELVLRRHLPVAGFSSYDVLCLCDVSRTYVGPVGQRLHVAAALREAGMLRG